MSSDLITRLRAYAAGKTASLENTAIYGKLHPVTYVRGKAFALFILKGTVPYIELACEKSNLETLLEAHPQIVLSRRSTERDRKGEKVWKNPNWDWINAPVDGSIPETLIIELIDHSYQMVTKYELSELDHHLVALREGQLAEDEALIALIQLLGLDHRHKQIRELIEPAIMLATTRASEAELQLGQTKVGGVPDMPKGVEWPTFKGQSLGFLAQVNLKELPPVFAHNLLPHQGLLLFFSILGLEGFFETSKHEWFSTNWSEHGFSQVLYVSSDANLERRAPAIGTHVFPSNAVQFVVASTLPAADEWTRDPIVSALKWSESEYERLTKLQYELQYVLRIPFGHQLLGHASPIQASVTELGERLLFVIDSDYDNAGMMWSDAGQIYFVISEEALARQDFTQIKVELQDS